VRSVVLAFCLLLVIAAPCAAADGTGTPTPWWAWPLVLFGVTFLLGILAVLGGVGGAVLFVPVVSGFFPVHIDFVRATGLLVALCGALAAGPGHLKTRLASLRLAMPLALVASAGSIAGAVIGLALPAHVVQTALGATILGILVVMVTARQSVEPRVPRPDAFSAFFHIHGNYTEPSTGHQVAWQVHRTPLALLLFAGIGILAGMFGLGAGWANVPVLNLVMGVPLKLAVGTSTFFLSITDTSAAWVYLNRGCVIPLLVVPSVLGIMLGSLVGVRVLRRTRPAFVRRVVIALLAFAGLKSLTKGLGVPFLF
jgi:uncharacterized membrane protein YfcA